MTTFRRLRNHAIGIVFVLLATPALADDSRSIDMQQEFSVQRTRILQDLEDGKTYSEIAPADRVAVVDALGRIRTALGTATSVDALSEAARIEVHNDQELVNTILTRARADSRLICEKRAQTGSHRRTTVCTTVAQRERQQNEAGDELKNRLYRTPGRRVGE